MTLETLATKLVATFDEYDLEWVDYGPPDTTDLQVALTGMVEYLSGIQDADGTVTIDLPNAHLKVERDPTGQHNVWVRVGAVEVDVDNDV
jgi:hypothetical protein